QLPAVPAVDVREYRNRVLDVTVLRAEHDHALGLDARQQAHAGARARILRQILARADLDDVAAKHVARIVGDVRDVRADGDLIETRDRRLGDIRRVDAVQALGELLLRERGGLLRSVLVR